MTIRFWAEEKALRGVLPWGRLEIVSQWGLALELINWDSDYDSDDLWSLKLQLGWPLIFIPLPIPIRRDPVDGMLDNWGFSFCERDTVHLNWGHRCKVIHLPWSWEHMSHEVRRPDGTWAKFVGSWEHSDIGDGPETFQLPYTYTLKSGEVQHRTATVYVSRTKWRRKWLRWTRFGEKVQQVIAIEFDDEVGESSGSWKGGSICCSHAMLPGETAEDTFRRMERERKF